MGAKCTRASNDEAKQPPPCYEDARNDYVGREAALANIIALDVPMAAKVQELMATGMVTERAFKAIVRQCKLQPSNITDWPTVLAMCISHAAEQRQTAVNDNKDRCYEYLMKATVSYLVMAEWVDTCTNADGSVDYDKLLLFAASAATL